MPTTARRYCLRKSSPGLRPACCASAATLTRLRGRLDPGDAGEWPDSLPAELTALGPARDAAGPAPRRSIRTPSPTTGRPPGRRSTNGRCQAGSCDCGALYKLITEAGDGRHDQFWTTAGEEGLLGDLAGVIARAGSGYGKRKTKSDACPACGRPFAETMARQADPQQPLF